MRIRQLIVFFFLCFSIQLSGQTFLDTLSEKLSSAKNDSAKLEIYFKAAGKRSRPQRLKDSLVAEARKYSSGCFGRSYFTLKLGMYYDALNQDVKATELYLRALSMADSCRNDIVVSKAYNRLGIINADMRNINTSILNFHQSNAYCRKTNNQLDIAENFSQLGTIYKNSGLTDSALHYHFSALEIRMKLKDKRLLSLTFNNIALVYKKRKDYKKALDYLNKAYQIKLEMKDYRGTASLNNNKANVYRLLKDYPSAVTYAKMAVDTAFKYKSGEYLNALATLAEAYEATGNFKNATETYKVHVNAMDSIKKDEVKIEFLEMQAKYESDKKDNEIHQKESDLKLSETENSKKNSIILFSIIALLATLVAVVFIFRSYTQSKRTTVQLSFKNKVIEEKNKEITDSIHYAKNIQQSLLTSEKVFSDSLRDYMVLLMPKDIVSGDFYWGAKAVQSSKLEVKSDEIVQSSKFEIQSGSRELPTLNYGLQTGSFLLMCADCTGHGVPGAFMSLLGISYLKEITSHGITRPDLVLNELRKKFIENFSLDTKDGMDAALIKLEGRKLEMAAANNPVWIIRNRRNIVIRADKFPIGKYYGEDKDFSLNTMQLEEDDLIILFSDGYADQFGGPNNKKYKYKQMEQFIIENSHLPLSELKVIMEQEIRNWKGKNEQVDDILVIGVRV